MSAVGSGALVAQSMTNSEIITLTGKKVIGARVRGGAEAITGYAAKALLPLVEVAAVGTAAFSAGSYVKGKIDALEVLFFGESSGLGNCAASVAVGTVGYVGHRIALVAGSILQPYLDTAHTAIQRSNRAADENLRSDLARYREQKTG